MRALVIDARPRGPRGLLAVESVLGRSVLSHLVEAARGCGDDDAIAVHARVDEHSPLRRLIADDSTIVFRAGPPPEGAAILRTDRLYDQARLRRVVRSGRDPESAVVWRLDRPGALASADAELIRRQTYQPLGRFWALTPAKALAHALTDVKVGALLSGGVDSSLVCWAIAKLGGNIGAFTIGTPNDPMDESVDSMATAKALGIPHQVISVGAETVPDVDELVSSYGEPFACASALGMLRVSKAVKSEATVLLTGDGGDDIFLGYPEHKNLWMAQKLANSLPPGTLSLWKQFRRLVPRNGPLRRPKHFFDYAAGGIGAVATDRDGIPDYISAGLLGERLKECTVPQRQIEWSSKSARNLLADFLELDRTTRFTGEYMTKVDGGAMRYAIEARSPFLDQKLWEYAGSLPFDLRLHNGTLKAILREIARRRIGERVASGAKKGFGIPVGKWLAGKWGTSFRELMNTSILHEKGYINAPKVLEQWERFAPSGSVPNHLWYIYVLETWFRYEQTVCR